LKNMLDQSGALRRTRLIAEDHVRRAREALAAFPACPARDSLDSLITFALERQT
jgi:geranylgeranyl pyrophosphate synthase